MALIVILSKTASQNKTTVRTNRQLRFFRCGKTDHWRKEYPLNNSHSMISAVRARMRDNGGSPNEAAARALYKLFSEEDDITSIDVDAENFLERLFLRRPVLSRRRSTKSQKRQARKMKIRRWIFLTQADNEKVAPTRGYSKNTLFSVGFCSNHVYIILRSTLKILFPSSENILALSFWRYLQHRCTTYSCRVISSSCILRSYKCFLLTFRCQLHFRTWFSSYTQPGNYAHHSSHTRWHERILAHVVLLPIVLLLGLETLDLHKWNVLSVQNLLESTNEK